MTGTRVTHGSICALLFLIAGAALAESSLSVEEVIERRQRSYESLSDDLAKVAQLLKQGNAETMAQIRPLTQSLVVTGAHLRDAFPPGSDQGKTRARAAIWRNPDDFAQRLARLNTALADLNRAAEAGSPDRTRAALQDAAGSCRACHFWYRALW
jgi:cytochrome c556